MRQSNDGTKWKVSCESFAFNCIGREENEEVPGVHSFEQVALDGALLPAFSAGAHIDVHGPTGIVRQYSLCNHPGDRTRYLIAVLRDPKSRGGSAAMHDQVDIPALRASQRDGTHLYACGPTGFLEAVLNAARAQQWPDDHIHYEYFGGAATKGTSDLSLSVKIVSSGVVYPIAAEKSVVAALAEYGVDIPVSCAQGICGTCLTRVLAGEPDNQDQFLTNEERATNKQFLPCCSCAFSPPFWSWICDCMG